MRAVIQVVVVFAALVGVLVSLGKFGAEVGTTGLLVLVCLAVLAIVLLRRRDRSDR
jgi:hypothetical protein